jgi:hypothetical protein
LDKPVGDYTDPFSAAPVTTYQFLAIWTKFTPAQYHSTYFLHDEVQQKWSVDRELIITILTALERLQHVITDIIGIVGEEHHHFVIDQDSKLTEQLWTSNQLKELILAVANTSPSAEWIWKGDVLGMLHDPDQYLDRVKKGEETQHLEAYAQVVQKIAQGSLGDQDLLDQMLAKS